jgi:hypothetical protein
VKFVFVLSLISACQSDQLFVCETELLSCQLKIEVIGALEDKCICKDD